MRELLLIVGLITIGYLAQSSVGVALNRSAEFYEGFVTDSQDTGSKPLVPRRREAVLQPNNAMIPLAGTKLLGNLRGDFDSDRGELSLSVAPDIDELKVSQNTPESTRSIR